MGRLVMRQGHNKVRDLAAAGCMNCSQQMDELNELEVHAQVEMLAGSLDRWIIHSSDVDQCSIKWVLAHLHAYRYSCKYLGVDLLKASALGSAVAKVTEGHQDKLEKQHWNMTKLQKQQEHILRFASWALESSNNTALLLSKKMIYFQLHHSLKVAVDPVEPLGDLRFQWDSETWTKHAEFFGKIVSDKTGVLPSSHNSNSQVLTPLTNFSPMVQNRSRSGQGREGESSGLDSVGQKRGRNSEGGDNEQLKKVPRVSLERLDVDLSPATQPPVFKVFPGNTTEDYNLIVIERGNAAAAAAAAAAGGDPIVKEEAMETGISIPTGESNEEKPQVRPDGLPENASAARPASATSDGIASDAPGASTGLSDTGSVARCKVCQKDGTLLTCGQCKNSFHRDCHLPAVEVARYCY
ncbi:hypothetical protein AB205_0148340 [Aquarana catesbeiana]|uniref:PHD-type domain-containing protein n=1 Tax=Aquarana catesbeiana TaxID=8400 RepID=A0A2G9R6G0_AQUCT|nr:hypothetical protein AB205_0148340 [Aquarana catesbeiana]